MISFIKLALIIVSATMVVGCSGPKYACKAPAGVGCKSISATYHSASQSQDAPSNGKNDNADTAIASRPVITHTDGPVPARRGARVLRVWYTPWVDAQGDWHDQSYVHVVVDDGRWLLHENRRSVGVSSYRNLQPPKVQPVTRSSNESQPSITQDDARAAAADFIKDAEPGRGVAR